MGLGSFNRIIKHEAKNLRLFFHCSFRDWRIFCKLSLNRSPNSIVVSSRVQHTYLHDLSHLTWVVPLPIHTGKWRFSLQSPSLHLILVVTITGKRDNPTYIQLPIITVLVGGGTNPFEKNMRVTLGELIFSLTSGRKNIQTYCRTST